MTKDLRDPLRRRQANLLTPRPPSSRQPAALPIPHSTDIPGKPGWIPAPSIAINN
jgi:hypothetical protein